MNTNRAARYSSAALASFSAISLGALSFIGMLVITSSLPWAVASFLLASVIEGEIYHQIILEAVKNLFVKGPVNELQRSIAKRELARTSKRYQKLLLVGDKKAAIAMENAFLSKILDPEAVGSPYFLQLRQQILAETRRKKFALWFSGVLGIGAAIASGFATLIAAHTGLLSLGAGASLALSGAAGIAILSSIGYAFIMYQSLADMIQNDTLQRWAKKTKDFFSLRKQETTLGYLGRCIPTAVFVLGVLAIATFATVATAGTWWFATKRGAMLINIFDKLAAAIRSVTVVCMALPNLIFNAYNALNSVLKISNYSRGRIKETLSQHYLEPLQNKNLLQCLNPFYWVGKTAAIFIHAGVFIGHLISIGLTSDGLPKVPPQVSAAGGAAIEFLTDWHFLFEFGEHHDHDHADDDHGHNHSDLPAKLAGLILLPLTILAKLWDWSFASFHTYQPVAASHQCAHSHGHGHHHHDEDENENHGHSHRHDETCSDTLKSDTYAILTLLDMQNVEEANEYDDMPELIPIESTSAVVLPKPLNDDMGIIASQTPSPKMGL